MYTSSSLFGDRGPSPSYSPCLVFHGPDAQGNVSAIDSHNQEVACFTLSKDALTRIRPFQQPVCTYKKSRLSGATTIDIKGQQVKMMEVIESLGGNSADVDTAFGKLKWRPENGSDSLVALRDSSKKLLARGTFHGTFKVRPEKLEVLVPGDEYLLDLILASWIALFKGQELDLKDIKDASDVLSFLGNVMGVGS